ncbi:metallophosphoesterase family protein [Zobellia russellii]|uniref:metallophosphoesterase family protein n=1 Tax=Zobellia russellii TaxID=248907 RepID=UPI001BFEFA85|nr:metallophosphoesterase [Zobellia russellii]MBT9187794.1 metallophosphoesterase [Zobellia russellii]
MFRKVMPYLLVVAFYGCKTEPSQKENSQKEIKVAFMADIHFADVYPNLDESDFKGIYDSVQNRSSLLRTMNAQLHSTRLFNENYFAFFAALDDAVAKGIKTIALPGDFSDDGQPLHIKGLRKILDRYAAEYDIEFFLINGNHDPTTPFGDEGGKSDFLGANGKAQPLMSEMGKYRANEEYQNPTQVVADLQEWGYADMVQELHNHGFFPKENYLFWSTPFSEYSVEEYTFEKAKTASDLARRNYRLETSEVLLPDVSYVVEPVEGLWLLALDANVYLPKENGGFSNAGIGYNEVLTHKKHLIRWTEKVVKEANRLGKTLIAYSHYPMVDFNDGASKDIAALFGEKAFQAHRIPSDLVGETFADIGLKVHVGGHMHLNDTGVFTTKRGNTLVNIQSPSLAAYVPAYKIITIKNPKHMKVETVVLDEVKGYDIFFDAYEREHDFRASHFADEVWEKDILSTASYLDYTKTHLQELVRLQFLPSDWPEELVQQLLNRNGWELLTASNSEEKIKAELQKEELTIEDFSSWQGMDLIVDFYKFRNGDELAKRDIDATHLKAYEFLLDQWSQENKNDEQLLLKQFASIFKKQMVGEPSENFSVNIRTGELIPY